MAKRVAPSMADPPFGVPPAWPASKVEMRPLDKITPYDKNPRTHPAAQIAILAQAMRDDGVTMPILVDDAGVIIAGHGRLLAAQANKFSSYPVVVARGWSEEQKRAARLRDNQIGLLSGWDIELMRGELVGLKTDGYDLMLLGFQEAQLRMFGVSMGTDSGQDPEQAPERPKKPTSRRGDLWLLGEHRLVCGDSTSESDVALCIGKAVPNLMVTDPPYGVNYDPGWRAEPGKLGAVDGSFLSTAGVRKGAVQNDERASWTPAYDLFPGDIAYVWHGALFSSVVETSLHNSKFLTRAQIVWAKQHAPISRGDYHWRHECCWYMVRKGKTARWAGDRKQNTVWDIANMNAFGGNQEDTKTQHGTQKPLECMKRPIENNSRKGDHVYDPFLGSGTTLIAAEMTGRRCLGLELDPGYCDVIVERWQTFTGKAAQLGQGGPTFAEVQRARSKVRPTGNGAPAARAQAPAPKSERGPSGPPATKPVRSATSPSTGSPRRLSPS